MKKFKHLLLEDKVGLVPAIELFDIIFYQIYNSETDPFISCTIDKNSCDIEMCDAEGVEYWFQITKDWKISFFADNKPLHFNQYPVYKKLLEQGFIII